jgi:hypothetical protein
VSDDTAQPVTPDEVTGMLGRVVMATTYDDHLQVGQDLKRLARAWRAERAEVERLRGELAAAEQRFASAEVLPERWRALMAERDEMRDALTVAMELLDRFASETPCAEGGDTCREHGYARKPCPHPLARQLVAAWREVEKEASQ